MNNKNNKRRKSTKEIKFAEKYNWETLGLELLHQKYKHNFTSEEKDIIKNMLKVAPPPLQYRQKVS